MSVTKILDMTPESEAPQIPAPPPASDAERLRGLIAKEFGEAIQCRQSSIVLPLRDYFAASLEIELDTTPMCYALRVHDPKVLQAASTVAQHGDLDALLLPYDIRRCEHGGHLEAFGSWGELPGIALKLRDACRQILAEAQIVTPPHIFTGDELLDSVLLWTEEDDRGRSCTDWNKIAAWVNDMVEQGDEPPASVTSDAALVTALHATEKAQIEVCIGNLCRALGSNQHADTAEWWLRWCQMHGFTMGTEPPTFVAYGGALDLFLTLLANMESTDRTRHFVACDRAMRRHAEIAAELARVKADEYEDNEQDREAAEWTKAAQRFERIAKGGAQ